MHAARMLALLVAVAVALLAAGGCRPSSEPRFDTVPGPIRTVDIAIAVADDASPLSIDEWASLEALHDRYLNDFDRLRIEAIAPLVRAVRNDPQRQWSADSEALARFAKRHAMVVGRVRALDENFSSDLALMLPERSELIERLTDRRAIARSVRVIEGLGDGRADGPTILDIEPQVRALRLDAAQRATIEPVLAAYRRDLARAAQDLAMAEVDYPRARLLAMAAANIDDARLNELRSHAKDGADQKAAADTAEAAHAAAERQARRARLQALVQIDAANTRAVDAIRLLLPEELGLRLAAAAERRRTTETAPTVDYAEFVLDVYRLHPTVRSGGAPSVAAAIERVDRAVAALRSAQVAADRARLEHDARGLAPEDPPESKRLQELQQRFIEASSVLVEAVKSELKGELTEELQNANRTTPDQMRQRLSESIGEAGADRVMRRASRTLFRNPLVAPPDEWDSQKSIAEQLLLAPGMDHAAFRLAARALGARDDDPLIEQLWDRHQARAEAIELRQRVQFKALEARTEEESRSVDANPAGFERTIADFLAALLAADAERRAADEETFQEIAIALGVAPTDGRFVLARAISAARRAALPWRRFDQPWLLGPLWEADAELVWSVLTLEADDLTRQAAMVVLAAHGEALAAAADNARRTGLESLRDLLLLGLRLKRTGADSGDPAELRETPEARALAQRVLDAGRARRAAQRAAIESMVQALPAERGAAIFEAWSRETFPEFYAEGQAWKEAREAVRAGALQQSGEAARATSAAAIERWKLVEDDMVRRVAQWQDRRAQVKAPSNGAELATAGAADAELGALRTLRDENAWRLLRALASAAGEPPDARMPGEDGLGTPPRTVRWSN